jgi:hypothetical protein
MDLTGGASMLQRIVAIMGNNDTPFLGLEFIYNNGERQTYGRRCSKLPNGSEILGVEVPFLIDAEHGERISAIRVTYWGLMVHAIEVSTIQLLSKHHALDCIATGTVIIYVYWKTFD